MIEFPFRIFCHKRTVPAFLQYMYLVWDVVFLQWYCHPTYRMRVIFPLYEIQSTLNILKTLQ